MIMGKRNLGNISTDIQSLIFELSEFEPEEQVIEIDDEETYWGDISDKLYEAIEIIDGFCNK